MYWILIPAPLIILYPYLRFMCRRAGMYIGVRAACARRGYTFRSVNRALLFSNAARAKADFYIEGEDRVYAVKLIGVTSRRLFWRFDDERHYALRDMRFQNYFTARSVQYGKKHVGKIDFTYKYDPRYAGKERKDIILMNPIPASITMLDGGTLRTVENGDFVHWGYIYSKSGFIEELCGESRKRK